MLIICISLFTAFKLNLVLSFIESLAGTYELIPYYKGENTVFDVSPPVMSVTVEHQHVTVPQKFQVRCIAACKVKIQTFGVLIFVAQFVFPRYFCFFLRACLVHVLRAWEWLYNFPIVESALMGILIMSHGLQTPMKGEVETLGPPWVCFSLALWKHLLLSYP